MKTTARSALKQTIGLFIIICGIVSTGFVFAVFQQKDVQDRIEFELTGVSGETVTRKDMGGKWLVVYFGFTSCADVCPTQSAKVAKTMRLLEKKRLSSLVVPVFISVDHIRDTPQKLYDYAAKFDGRIMALTGTPAQLDQVTQSFDTHYEVRKINSSHRGNIDVIHSSMTYIIDPFGRITERIAFGHNPEFLANHLATLL